MTNNTREIKEVDLTRAELKLIAENMNAIRYDIIAGNIEKQIQAFIYSQSNSEVLKKLKKFKKFFGKEKEFKKMIKKGGVDFSNHIFWLWNMIDTNRRNSFNVYYETMYNVNFFNSEPFSDMRDIYISLLYRKYIEIDKQQDIDNDILNHECFNDLKKENMRENFKIFLKYNFEEVA